MNHEPPCPVVEFEFEVWQRFIPQRTIARPKMATQTLLTHLASGDSVWAITFTLHERAVPCCVALLVSQTAKCRAIVRALSSTALPPDPRTQQPVLK